MDIELKIAVLSDLHIGGASKGADLRIDNKDQAPVEKYIEEFEVFVDKESIYADYLVVPGDITNSCKRDEAILASSVVNDIARILKVSKDKVVFCPGNHDANWDVASGLKGMVSDDVIISTKLSNLLDPSLVFGRSNELAVGSFDKHPYYVIWEFDDVVFISLNSSVYDSPDVELHQGEIKISQLDELSKELSFRKLKEDKDKLKIFLLHHHPVLYDDIARNYTDYSAIKNSEKLKSILYENKIDFLIHGHRHMPKFNVYMESQGHPIGFLSAGSFSAKIEEPYFGPIGNSFHIIEHHGRCNETLYSRGVIKSWSHFVGNGWKKSRTDQGVDHIHNFGVHKSPAEIRKYLMETIDLEISEKNVIVWKNFVKDDECLKYVQNLMLINELKTIGSGMGLVLHNIDDVNLEDLIIYRDGSYEEG